MIGCILGSVRKRTDLSIGPAGDELHNTISIQVKGMDAHRVIFRLKLWEEADEDNIIWIILELYTICVYKMAFKEWWLHQVIACLLK